MSPRVLIVDDDATIRHVLKRIFSRAGFQVTDVASGLEALASARRQAFDLITMDMAMEQLDGLDTIAILQNETQTPIVVISAHLTEEIHEELYRRGVTNCLSKPFTIDQVLDIAHRALS